MKLKPIFCLLLLLAAATAGAHDFEVDGIYYNITGDNEAEVTYKGDYYYTDNNRYTGEVTIPKTVTEDGVTFAVTSIGDYAFWQCSGMTGLTIASSVTSIGDDALYGCVGLTSILVENGNPSYDSRDNCNAIIETASNTLIAGCQNTIIPNTVTAIGNGAFQRCSGLTGLIIPNSVTAIGPFAFDGCTALTSLTIPSSVISIGYMAFRNCKSLMGILVDSGNPCYDSRDNCNAIIEAASNKLIVGCQNSIIPNTIVTIGEYAFNGCSGLQSVTIPNTVVAIGDYAFDNCSGLTSLTIPYSVTSIGEYAFRACSGLTSIEVENGNPSYDSRDNCNAIIVTPSDMLIVGCRNTIIPNTVTTIGDYAFSNCRDLTDIIIPNSVTSINNSAFENCSGLTSIAIPNSVTNIDTRAFYNCRGLTSITIPNSVTRIGYTAFAFCSELKDVYSYITDLAKVNLGQRIFEDFNDNYLKRTLHVPAGTAEQYRSSFSWYPYFRWIEEMGPNCDVNGDNAVNIGDVNQVIDIILSGHHSDKGDVNGDGVVNISDINAIINYILTH